jgi:3-methyladenine DNA glycosylase Mpg
MLITEEFMHTSTFDEIANFILNRCILKVSNEKFRICEIEFYKFNDQHQDAYTHRDPDQQKFGKFYFHKYPNGTYKAGTYKCVDIAFGNSNTYFGILIRSIMNKKTKEFIEGPCRSVNKMLEILGFNDVKSFMDTRTDLIDIGSDSDLSIKINNNLIQYDIFKGMRVGLGDKYPNFKELPYRFATNISKIKKQKKFISVE